MIVSCNGRRVNRAAGNESRNKFTRRLGALRQQTALNLTIGWDFLRRRRISASAPSEITVATAIENDVVLPPHIRKDLSGGRRLKLLCLRLFPIWSLLPSQGSDA
jgi:hypothetical protein